ncbi:MAG: peptidoglycan-binding protein [Acidimicrobiia bacterium]|nr:peptidoglycan-binding protein [Acidimicrobiia bacterium]
MGADLGVEPNFLMAIMSFETGGTFDPAQRNLASSDAVGLIQFMPKTAAALGTSVEELAGMTAEDQLDVVARYFEPFRGRLATLEDAYMAVLLPTAIGKGPGHVLFRQGSTDYDQNRGLDRDGDGEITVGEVTAKVRERLGGVVIEPLSDLRQGDRGSDVEILQQKLVDLGHLSVEAFRTAPGTFGVRTAEALQAFQSAMELNATGVYDAATHAVMALLDLGVRRGRLGGVVLPLQHRLISHDLLSGTAVEGALGTFGPLTQQALIAFQTNHDLEPNGILTEETYRVLFVGLDPRPTRPEIAEPVVGGVIDTVTAIPSYRLSTYTILDNLALVREPDDIHSISRYDTGDPLPPGTKVGDRKIIPMFTEVRVMAVRTDEGRNAYVLAEPVDPASTAPAGWTRATNLGGQFLNELVGYVPSEWDLPPQGNNFTVTDPRSLVRNGPPTFRSLGTTIPVGTYVVVTARSEDTDPIGKFVSVGRGEIEAGAITAIEPLGWTASSNLTDGCSKVFTTDAWLSQTGPNACWRRGRFIGAKILVNIVGTGGQMEQLTLDSLAAYLDLKDAAAQDGIEIGVVSAFRTFQQQKKLRDRYLQGTGNLAARPGHSNHQHGQAVDLNTGGFDGNLVYDWLKKNGPRLGFIRTVNREHWHWEHRPQDAARLAAEGKFKLSSVRK